MDDFWAGIAAKGERTNFDLQTSLHLLLLDEEETMNHEAHIKLMITPHPTLAARRVLQPAI
jgi:hypothetical protein